MLGLSDCDAWSICDPEDLWILDKLLLAKRLGHTCGPKGVPVPRPGIYIVRPVVNTLGMGIDASLVYLEKYTDCIPNGYFWCEQFKGRHISVDYTLSKQTLAVEGFKNSSNPLWKWSRWSKVAVNKPIPKILQYISIKYKYMNIEYIGNKIIEVHFRSNPDWEPDYLEIIPVFKGDTFIGIENYEYVPDPDYLRLGFYVKKDRP